MEISANAPCRGPNPLIFFLLLGKCFKRIRIGLLKRIQKGLLRNNLDGGIIRKF